MAQLRYKLQRNEGNAKRAAEKKESATLRTKKTTVSATPKTSKTKSAVSMDTARASATAKANATALKQAQAAWSKWTSSNRTAPKLDVRTAKASIEKKFGVKLP